MPDISNYDPPQLPLTKNEGVLGVQDRETVLIPILEIANLANNPWLPLTAWATNTQYVVGPPTSLVSVNGSTYVCLVAHYSTTFAADLAAGKWGLVAQGSQAWTAPSAWVTATAYTIGPPASLVTQGGASYVCLVNHTSGVSFSADLAAGKWILVAQGSFGIDVGIGAPTSGAGNNGDFYIDNNALVIYGPKASGAWPATGTPLWTPYVTFAPQGSLYAWVDQDGIAAGYIGPDGSLNFGKMVAASVVAGSVGTVTTQMTDVPAAGVAMALALDQDGLMAAYVDNTGAVHATNLQDIQSINGVSIGQILSGGSGTVPQGSFTAEVNHFIGYGQSKSNGTNSVPAISTTQLYDSLMFSGGVRAYELSSTPAVIYASLVPAVERTSTDGVSLGETPMSGLADAVKERILAENQIAFGSQSYQLLISDEGAGGNSIAQLSKGGSPYAQLMADVQAGYTLSQAAGKSFKFRGWTWSQGEADYAAGTTDSTYLTALQTLATNIATDAKAITGQAETPYCSFDQICDHNTYGSSNNPHLGLLQLAQAVTPGSGFFMATPAYVFPTATVGFGYPHWTNIGSQWNGAYHGLLYKRLVVDKAAGWLPLYITGAYREGNIVMVSFNVPKGALKFDTIQVAGQTNMGFTMVDNTGAAITINSISVVNGCMVKIVCATNPPAGSQVRYGYPGAGNLRDSQGDTITFQGSGINKRMDNWCCISNATMA